MWHEGSSANAYGDEFGNLTLNGFISAPTVKAGTTLEIGTNTLAFSGSNLLINGSSLASYLNLGTMASQNLTNVASFTGVGSVNLGTNTIAAGAANLASASVGGTSILSGNVNLGGTISGTGNATFAGAGTSGVNLSTSTNGGTLWVPGTAAVATSFITGSVSSVRMLNIGNPASGYGGYLYANSA